MLRVRGPLGDPVDAEYGLIDGGSTAVIEMAKAAGLALVPKEQRDPRITTTYGVGELLQHAYDADAHHFVVGIGGSATNDGGAGMAQALGYHLLDQDGLELPPGGLGAGLVAFAGARLQPGAEMVMEVLHLDERLMGAQLVITGEGRLDSQTARFGKGPAAVARHAKNAGIPVVAIGGSVADETELRLLFDGLEATVVAPGSLDEVIAQARPLLVRAATRLMWLVLTGRRLP